MCHHISWWELGICRHRWIIHHIFLILNLLILNLLIFQSQRDVDEFLNNPFGFLQMMLNVMLLILSLLLQSLLSEYLWAWYVILADRIIEKENQTNSDGEEWKIKGDDSVQHQRINHICDLQMLMKGERKSLGPCTADQGQINALQTGGLMQLNNTQQANLGLSLNLN